MVYLKKKKKKQERERERERKIAGLKASNLRRARLVSIRVSPRIRVFLGVAQSKVLLLIILFFLLIPEARAL